MPGKTEDCSVLGDCVVSCAEVWSLNMLIARRALYTPFQICLFFSFQGGSSMTEHWTGTRKKKPYVLLPAQPLPHQFNLKQFFHTLHFGFSIGHMEMKDLIFYGGFCPFHWPYLATRTCYSTLIPQLRCNPYVTFGRAAPSNYLMYSHCKRFGLSLTKNTQTT